MIIKFKMVLVAEVHTHCDYCGREVVVDLPDQDNADLAWRMVMESDVFCSDCARELEVNLARGNALFGVLENASH